MVDEDMIALVGSRICHDLVNPLSAISNGLELLLMAGGSETEEHALIRTATENATARLNFFRIAFGHGNQDSSMGAQEVSDLLETLSSGARHHYLWQHDGDISRADLRSVFLAMMCIESALPMGGAIAYDGTKVVGNGKRVAAATELWGPLAQGRAPDELPSSKVQFALLPTFLGRAGKTPNIEIGEAELTISF